MNTLFDKIWDSHVVQIVEDGPTQLYIDRLYCHHKLLKVCVNADYGVSVLSKYSVCLIIIRLLTIRINL